jgi:hypothetical protein
LPSKSASLRDWRGRYRTPGLAVVATGLELGWLKAKKIMAPASEAGQAISAACRVVESALPGL